MRIDELLFKQNYYPSRTKAKQAIERGEVLLNGKTILKSSFDINENSVFTITKNSKEEYVSLGGYKMAKALSDFNYSVKGVVAADIGSSTGGFTDCLIQNGAETVYAVDLNDDLLDKKLKNNIKVKPIIKNTKFLNRNDFIVKPTLMTVDLSFISASLILPILSNIIDDKNDIILLIKPQFENDKKTNFKNGIIRDKKIRYEACKKVLKTAIDCNLYPQKITTAPLYDNKNTEYLVLLTKGFKTTFDLEEYFS